MQAHCMLYILHIYTAVWYDEVDDCTHTWHLNDLGYFFRPQLTLHQLVCFSFTIQLCVHKHILWKQSATENGSVFHEKLNSVWAVLVGNKHDCTQVQAHRQQVHALHMSRAYTVCISHVLMHDIIMYINLRIPICTLQLALCVITSYNILTPTVRSGRRCSGQWNTAPSFVFWLWCY